MKDFHMQEKDMAESLYQKLKRYSESDYLAFHMPGHKRKEGIYGNPFRIDITEIDEFDDLHHPEEQGILVRAQERAARLYGASETHFLINGSTAGILSAVSGCTARNGQLLMARNCHRSVYHAAELRNLKTVYLYPQYVDNPGINGGILPEDVEKALEENREIQAVILTSPTYDGICSDVKQIAEICHRFRIPLIVDQAHGAHFPFSDLFPADALKDGADVVIHSVHKTLPSLTQTALLHINGKLVDRERLRHYLSVYQSSSPSYVLMASIDSCMEFLEREGAEAFRAYERRLEKFRDACKDLRVLELADTKASAPEKVFDADPSKLLISCRNAGITGKTLSALLRERYHIQMEMSAPTYALGISGTADREEDFERLSRALHELDSQMHGRKNIARKSGRVDAKADFHLQKAESCVTLGEALERPREIVKWEDSEGRVSGSYLYVYPPGIPLLAPGERISAELREQTAARRTAGLEIHGLSKERLAVLAED